MLSIDKIETLEGFRELRPDWNRILEITKSAYVFLTHEWQFAWWQTYSRDRSLYILVVKDNDLIVGIAPLMISGGKRPILQFIGTPNADYCDFIGETGVRLLQLLCDYIVKDRKWRRLELSQVPESSEFIKKFERILAGNNTPFRKKEIETCYYYKFDGIPGAYDDFNVRKNRKLKRAERHFGGRENLTIRVLENRDDILRILPTFYNYHINRWQETSTPSKFLDRVNRQFYEGLVDSLSPLNRICLICLYHDHHPVAFCFGYMYRNVLSLYGIAYDLYQAKGSPGQLLLAYTVEKFVRRGYLIDLSRGADSYKTAMANESAGNYQFLIYRHRRQLAVAEFYDRLKSSGPARMVLDNKKLADLKDKFIIKYRKLGLKRFIMTFIDRLLRFFVDYQVIKIYVQEGDPHIDDKPAIDIEIRQMNPEDLPLIASYYGLEPESNKCDRIIDRFKRNSECFVAYHDGNFATIFWILCHEDPDPATGFVLVPDSKQVIISDGITSPIYRGKGIMPYLINCSLKKYYRENYQVLAAVMKSNYSMIKILDRYKYHHVRNEKTLKILGRKII